MFTHAYKIAANYTIPVIQSIRYFNDEIESGVGSFILLNDFGWVLTAAHIIEGLNVYNQHKKEIEAYDKKVTDINAESRLSLKQKNRKIKKIPINPKWIKNISHWWGSNEVRIPSFEVMPGADIAIGQIKNFEAKPTQIYPKFKITSDDFLGKSLCKLGFPFYEIKTTWDSSTGNFKIPPNIFPIPRFPIDGIGTRFIIVNGPNNMQIKLLETSSPGLKGQSGGPIFDVEGNVCALQSRTNHYPLGFNIDITTVKGRKTTEHQFLNVGVGITTETILDFLKSNNVEVNKIQ